MEGLVARGHWHSDLGLLAADTPQSQSIVEGCISVN